MVVWWAGYIFFVVNHTPELVICKLSSVFAHFISICSEGGGTILYARRAHEF